MADFPTDNYLIFNATDNGTTLSPTTDFINFSGSFTVVDSNTDNDIDTGDYYFDTNYPYSGYTISLNGNTYAIFEYALFPGNFYVPYDSNFDDLSGLDGTPVTQPITQTGDNAVVANCFAADTLIATPQGEVRVDTLATGDWILGTDGQTRQIKWVGRQTMQKLFAGPRIQPVRLRAGALGQGLPHSDLTLTGDHGLLIDGMILNAAALVNGTTIDWVPLADLPARVTYYHIETEDHAVIRANGAAAETFIDYTGRQAFDNYAEYEDLYGHDRTIPELPYPRISAARLVPAAIRDRLGIAVQKVA